MSEWTPPEDFVPPEGHDFAVIPPEADFIVPAEEGLKPREADEIRRLLMELAARQIEGLRLYEPLPIINTFHACTKDERLLRGSNRAGKTLGAAAEFARAVTGQDPFGKFPKKDGVAFAIGQNQKHLGGVMFKKLFRPGAFKMIRDLATGQWRAFRPETDMFRVHEVRPAPPLIPARMLAEPIAWEDKKLQVPSRAVLTNGWVIQFFASGGQPPNGVDIDLFWIDEEIDNEAWYSELVARLLDRKGKFIWSATPQVASEALYALHERADAEPPDPLVAEFLCLLTDNPHIEESEKEKLWIRLSDEDRRVRYHGEYAHAGFRVYPEFDFSKIHAWPADGWQVPANWARYLAVDPGRQVCACLFLAVPPPGEGKFVVIHDELYLRNCDADTFGKSVADKSTFVVYESMLIDNHAARITEMGSGMTVEYQYSRALLRHQVTTRHGGGFLAGADDPKAGIERVRDWLRIRPDGTSFLRVAKGRCPQLAWEVQRYHYKRDGKKQVTDQPEKRHDHLMDCFDEKTEVLTSDGWKSFAHLPDSGEWLATVNLETDRIEYQQHTALIARQHEGQMVKIGGHKMDALVTPEHRMVVYPREACTGYDGGKPVIKLAKDLTIWDKIKLHARWDAEGPDAVFIKASGMAKSVRVDPGDYAEFLGWYVAEGSCARTIRMPGHGYSVIVSQNPGAKREKLRSLLKRLPWHWCENKDGFYTSCKQLWEEVSYLGDAYTKILPHWIPGSSSAVIGRFLDGAILGDGWKQGERATYATVSARLANQIQELFIKTGRSASIRQKEGVPYCIKGRSGDNTVTQHWVSEWSCPHGLLRDSTNRPNFETVDYSGMVYCATVPNGTLIVRRNGKPMIAGNCLRYLAMYGPTWRQPKVAPKAKSPAVVAMEAKKKRKREKQLHTVPV